MLREGTSIIVDKVLRSEGKAAADEVERQILAGETKHPAAEAFAEESRRVQEEAARNAEDAFAQSPDKDPAKAAQEGTEKATQDWFDEQGSRKSDWVPGEAGETARQQASRPASGDDARDVGEKHAWPVDLYGEHAKSKAVDEAKSDGQSEDSSGERSE